MQAFQFFINPILAKIVLVLLQYFKELCTQHTIASNAPIEKEKRNIFCTIWQLCCLNTLIQNNKRTQNMVCYATSVVN